MQVVEIWNICWECCGAFVDLLLEFRFIELLLLTAKTLLVSAVRSPTPADGTDKVVHNVFFLALAFLSENKPLTAQFVCSAACCCVYAVMWRLVLSSSASLVLCDQAACWRWKKNVQRNVRSSAVLICVRFNPTSQLQWLVKRRRLKCSDRSLIAERRGCHLLRPAGYDVKLRHCAVSCARVITGTSLLRLEVVAITPFCEKIHFSFW